MSGLEKALFNLKFTSKQLNRQAAKADKDARTEQAKIKKALTQTPPQPQIAKLYATNSVRNQQQRIQLLTLAARIDAVAARVQTAITMRTVTGSMAQTVRGMDIALKSMDLEKIGAVMEKFESQFEDLDVVSGYYENVAGGVESQQVGVEGHGEVDALMARVADEAGVELNQELQSGKLPEPEVPTEQEREAGLGDRLRALRAS
ncbi:Vacuolar-sorting protein SNF7 [Lithohypha guttulata]|uniref:Vacuolar-sorting protein SNF7 n=1 Tax=Lithohypha guttulata TaxID=1690604 RepID=A0AAN7SU72_9EURO|nr:Vacuolar-sorting protein SNF7 [Lithohypha guttulata]KAK5081650.1 Vacuolar-sorting protein SNF7 [Lithohypha guttulata]KAK5104956.1 Vacuolar-sorting protein SNF7 [Lithohypha guttulata]